MTPGLTPARNALSDPKSSPEVRRAAMQIVAEARFPALTPPEPELPELSLGAQIVGGLGVFTVLFWVLMGAALLVEQAFKALGWWE